MPVGAETVAALPFFARLTAEQVRAVTLVLVERDFEPEAMIFEEGTPGMAWAFILDGTVHAEVNVGPGQPRERINTMGRGEFFGEVSLLDGGPRTASCVAGAHGARIALLDHHDFGRLFEAGNPFAFSIIRLVTRQLARRMQNTTRMWREAARSELDPTDSG